MRTLKPETKESRRSVIDAALRLVDRGGLSHLTMRALADEVGTAPMNLYAHFKGRPELLDLLFEGIIERMLETQKRSTWKQDLEEACRHARGVLLAHPHWLPLLARVTMPMPSLRFYDRLFDGMRRDGFAPAAALHAFSTALSFTLGEVLVEQMMSVPHQPPVPVQQLALVRKLLPDMPAGAFPGVAGAVPSFTNWSWDGVFDMGIRTLIDGLEAHRTTPPQPRRVPQGDDEEGRAPD